MAANVPQAPPLSNDSMLQVFVHRSASAQGARLQRMGKRFLELAYTKVLMEKRPTLPAVQIENYVDINFPVFVAHWVNAYGWKTRMYAVPQGVNLDDPEESRTIFEIYAGAVLKDYPQPGDPRGDPTVLFNWIRDLVYISD